MSLRGRRHGGYAFQNALIFQTTCGPEDDFDPTITALGGGYWNYGDGIVEFVASGVSAHHTYASAGSHRAVFRPAGGLGSVTAIDCNADLITSIKNLHKLRATTYDLYTNVGLILDIGTLYKSATRLHVLGNTATYGSIAGFSLLTYLKTAEANVSGSLSDLLELLIICQIYGCPLISPASIAHLTALVDGRFYSMWPTKSAAESVDIVINSMWAARAAYTYASGPAMQIGGTNPDPTGNIVAPIEGTDWHEDAPGHWTPLTPRAKIYDLLNDVNSEGFNTWTTIIT